MSTVNTMNAKHAARFSAQRFVGLPGYGVWDTKLAQWDTAIGTNRIRRFKTLKSATTAARRANKVEAMPAP